MRVTPHTASHPAALEEAAGELKMRWDHEKDWGEAPGYAHRGQAETLAGEGSKRKGDVGNNPPVHGGWLELGEARGLTGWRSCVE